MMFDVAFKDSGAIIAYASSVDDEHPPEHIIDGCVFNFIHFYLS